MKFLKFEFEKITKSNGTTVIEGLSNANVHDRMKERIDPSAWKLENYMKNPVVLFDHGKDPCFGNLPVGKALQAGPTDNGLFTKIQLSNSKTEKITAVRDLVEEGILKTFSVGFNPITTEKDMNDPEAKVITSAELIEQSIVPVPMNQDSLFSVAKRYGSGNTVVKSWVLSKVSPFVTDDILAAVADELRMNPKLVKSILSGNGNPAETAFVVEACSKMLRLDKTFLVNNKDQEGKGMPSKKSASTSKKQIKNDTSNSPESQPPQTSSTEEVKTPYENAQTMVIHQILIPKDVAATPEEAAKMATDAGYKADQIDDAEDTWVLTQTPSDGLDLENGQLLDLGNGVMAHIAPKVSSAPAETPTEGTTTPMDQSQTEGVKAADTPPADTAPADQTPPKEGDAVPKAEPGKVFVVTEQDLVGLVDTYMKERKAVETDGAGNPPAWVADEGTWDHAKQMARAAKVDDFYAFAVWAYLNVLNGAKKSGVASATKSEKNIDGTDMNPYHELSRQTNVLLGTLINEVQKMSEKLNGLADISVKLAAMEQQPPEGDQNPPPTDGQPGAKSVDMLARFRRDLSDIDLKLKRLSV